MGQRSFALLGGSGLVGGQLLRQLADDPGYVGGTSLTRRALPDTAPGNKIREAVVDFAAPSSLRPYLAVDDVFCCLGSTIKKAGSEHAFRNVDCVIPAAVAREARAVGARQFLIVTAVGADLESRIFYNRVKGEVEASLRLLDFPAGLKIFRPSLILGERSERRPAERAMMAFMGATTGLFRGGLTRYRAIAAADVARAMVHAALEPERSGVRTYEGDALFKMARSGALPSTSGTRA